MERSVGQQDDAGQKDPPRSLAGVKALDIQAICRSNADGALDLTALLQHLLIERSDTGKTWAQRLVEGWINDAVEGNPKAIVDILDRTEKRRAAAASAAVALPPINDEIAGKILEILSGSGEVATDP